MPIALDIPTFSMRDTVSSRLITSVYEWYLSLSGKQYLFDAEHYMLIKRWKRKKAGLRISHQIGV